MNSIRSIHLLAFSAILANVCFAQVKDSPRRSDDDLRIEGVFEGHLPGTEKKFAIKAILHPHFGDLHRYSYLRVPIGVRYGISDNIEIKLEGETYFTHGLSNGSFGNESGISGYRFSAKTNQRFLPTDRWDQVYGFEYKSPTGNPPIEITDGLSRLKPYLNFSRRSELNPNFRYFWGIGLDIVSETSIPGMPRKNGFDQNSQFVTMGAIWEREKLSYTFETTYMTSRAIGETNQDFIQIRPGIIWEVPRRYTFNSRDNWTIGAALKAAHGRDGFDFGVALKFRINLDFKRSGHR